MFWIILEVAAQRSIAQQESMNHANSYLRICSQLDPTDHTTIICKIMTDCVGCRLECPGASVGASL